MLKGNSDSNGTYFIEFGPFDQKLWPKKQKNPLKKLFDILLTIHISIKNANFYY